MKLEQSKAIISGGVSGLGYAVAERLIAEGGQVTLLDINDEKGAEAISALGERATFINTDVRSEASVTAAVEQAAQRMDGLNVAVSCAGILGAARTLGREGPMALDFFSNVIEINLMGTFNLSKAAAHRMSGYEANAEGERGVIINTASVAAFEGQIGQAAYSASKSGVVGLTMPLAREFARFGIRVSTVAPGVFWTPMVDGMPQEVQDALSATIPFPSRLGQPSEFADTCAFIIGNPYINGETIRIDGATRLQPK